MNSICTLSGGEEKSSPPVTFQEEGTLDLLKYIVTWEGQPRDEIRRNLRMLGLEKFSAYDIYRVINQDIKEEEKIQALQKTLYPGPETEGQRLREKYNLPEWATVEREPKVRVLSTSDYLQSVDAWRHVAHGWASYGARYQQAGLHKAMTNLCYQALNLPQVQNDSLTKQYCANGKPIARGVQVGATGDPPRIILRPGIFGKLQKKVVEAIKAYERSLTLGAVYSIQQGNRIVNELESYLEAGNPGLYHDEIQGLIRQFRKIQFHHARAPSASLSNDLLKNEMIMNSAEKLSRVIETEKGVFSQKNLGQQLTKIARGPKVPCRELKYWHDIAQEVKGVSPGELGFLGDSHKYIRQVEERWEAGDCSPGGE